MELCFGSTNVPPSPNVFYYVKINFTEWISVEVAAQHFPFSVRHFFSKMSLFPCPAPRQQELLTPVQAKRLPRLVLLWDQKAVPSSDKRQRLCAAIGTRAELLKATFLQRMMVPATVEDSRDEYQTQFRSPPWGLESGLREGLITCQVVGPSESHFPLCRLGAKKGILQVKRTQKLTKETEIREIFGGWKTLWYA